MSSRAVILPSLSTDPMDGCPVREKRRCAASTGNEVPLTEAPLAVRRGSTTGGSLGTPGSACDGTLAIELLLAARRGVATVAPASEATLGVPGSVCVGTLAIELLLAVRTGGPGSSGTLLVSGTVLSALGRCTARLSCSFITFSCSSMWIISGSVNARCVGRAAGRGG